MTFNAEHLCSCCASGGNPSARIRVRHHKTFESVAILFLSTIIGHTIIEVYKIDLFNGMIRLLGSTLDVTVTLSDLDCVQVLFLSMWCVESQTAPKAVFVFLVMYYTFCHVPQMHAQAGHWSLCTRALCTDLLGHALLAANARNSHNLRNDSNIFKLTQAFPRNGASEMQAHRKSPRAQARGCGGVGPPHLDPILKMEWDTAPEGELDCPILFTPFASNGPEEPVIICEARHTISRQAVKQVCCSYQSRFFRVALIRFGSFVLLSPEPASQLRDTCVCVL
jgi:hypothetical protein